MIIMRHGDSSHGSVVDFMRLLVKAINKYSIPWLFQRISCLDQLVVLVTF